MERRYAFAGVEVLVDIPAEEMYPEERLLAPFAVERVTRPNRFLFRRAERLLSPEGACMARGPDFLVYVNGEKTIRYRGDVRLSWKGAGIRVERQGTDYSVQVAASAYNRRIGEKTVLTALGVEHLLAREKGYLLHSSLIEFRGRGILFTAPSETGKSTQAELWRKFRQAEIVNGDRAAVRIAEERVLACGVPFAGSSVYCENRQLPLAAIVCLAQAPVTSIRPLRGYEAFRRVWEGCSVNCWDRDDVEAISGAVMTTLERVPVFDLACTPDESAVLALERALAGRNL